MHAPSAALQSNRQADGQPEMRKHSGTSAHNPREGSRPGWMSVRIRLASSRVWAILAHCFSLSLGAVAAPAAAAAAAAASVAAAAAADDDDDDDASAASASTGPKGTGETERGASSTKDAAAMAAAATAAAAEERAAALQSAVNAAEAELERVKAG